MSAEQSGQSGPQVRDGQSGMAHPWWREPVWGLIVLLALAVIGALVIWGRPDPFADHATAPAAPAALGQQPHSSPAQIIPTFTGTVDRIEGGYLYLSNVTYSLGPNEPKPDATAEKVPVPAGCWVSDTHWQSTDGTVDIFCGQRVTNFIDQKGIMPDLHFIHGVVTVAGGDDFTVQVQEIEKGAGEGPQDVITHVGQEVALHMTPHAKANIETGRTAKVRDQLIIGWFGNSDTHLVWQMTFLD